MFNLLNYIFIFLFQFKDHDFKKCKENAYKKLQKVTSPDAMQITYWSVLDVNNMQKDISVLIKNAMNNINSSVTFQFIDQNIDIVSNSLKTRLKEEIKNFLARIIPLSQNILLAAESRKRLYATGPQSTYNMLCDILTGDHIIPPSAKDMLSLFSPQFDVDKLINSFFERPFNSITLNEKKANAKAKLVELSMYMDTALSNIDCFILSTMAIVGSGADTLKLLNSGRVIMSDKHPRAKALNVTVGIIKLFANLQNSENLYPVFSDVKNNEDDDDEDPDLVAQKNEVYLNTIPHLNHKVRTPMKTRNISQPLGIIIVHPNKQIDYKEVTDALELSKFVRNQSKQYELKSLTNPKFLKVNSKRLIDTLVEDVKKKANRNGMSKIEMVNEIIKHLKTN